MPVLIAVVYYLHDIPKYRRMQSRIELVTHEMASILQNISQKRKDKRITFDDIKYAMSAAFLTVFPGVTQYPDKGLGKPVSAFPVGYFPTIYVYCVIGNSDGTKASVIWLKHAYTDYYSVGRRGGVECADHVGSIVRYRTDSDPSSIYPGLKIASNEIKIIVECSFCYHQYSNWSFSNNTLCSSVPIEKAMGFYFMQLKRKTQRMEDYLSTVVIFTPKSGLFDNNAPT
ncbi:MAG: hypothetical protein LBB21_02125 [Holosporaceae bacterium]|jgi:hypothetical protein|nr:hypothetical protein [Holosporaceae bacterium]